MQKKLIAVAVAGLMSGAAFAQSNVTISGSLDWMYTTYTNDKTAGATLANDLSGHGDTTHKTNRIAYKGTEALGGGMSAFFELEERFNLDTGAANGTGRFARSSWVGLQGGFGKVYLGRVPTAGDMVFGGGKIANDDTIADWGSRKGNMDDRQGNGILYQSPKLGPLTLNVHTATKESDTVAAPLGISAALDFGMVFVEGAWQKDGAGNNGGTALTSSNMYKSMFLNTGLKLGSAANLYAYIGKSQGYQSYDYTGAPVGVNPLNETLRYAFGFDVKIGANGLLRTNLGKAFGETSTDGAADTKYYQLGVTYGHNLSKRTKVIVAATYEREGNMAKNGAASYTSRDDGKGVRNNRTGLQAGIRHAF